MKLIERGMEAREMLRHKRLEHKVDEAWRENGRLKAENHALREEGRRERSEMDRLLSALERVGEPHRRRGRGLAAVVMAAGGAYVLGARAGRDRYEQIASGWERLRSRGRRSLGEARRDAARDASAGVSSSDDAGPAPTWGMNARAAGPA
jgi:hypothetical protein